MWKCLKCGESLNDVYDLCWKCGADKEGETPLPSQAAGDLPVKIFKDRRQGKPRGVSTSKPTKQKDTKIDCLVCKQCGGEMRKGKKPIPVNQGFGCLLMLIGIFLCFTLIGIPIVIAGIVLSCQQQSVWVCKSCGYIIERA